MFRSLPNLLSATRLLLVPFILRALWIRDYRTGLGLVFVAGFTDALDGYLARRFQWTSRVGAYLDPMGDKLLLVSVYVLLGLQRLIPIWLTILVLSRDALILLMVAVAMAFTHVRSFPPSIWGKLSTVVQVATALLVLIVSAGFGANFEPVKVSAVLLTAILTAWSGIHYTWIALRQFPQARRERLIQRSGL